MFLGTAERLRAALLTALLLAVGVLLSWCGGGGGDGSGSGGDAYSVSPTSISFTAVQGGPTPAAKTSNVTVLHGTVFVLTAQSGTGFNHNFNITGATTGVVTITPDAPTTPGTFTGTITVQGCSNQFGPSCANVAGSPKVINVTYTVTPTPTLSSNPATLDFVTSTGNLPGSKSITLTLSSGSLPWTAGAPAYTSGTSGWLSVNPTSGTLNPSQMVTFSVTNASSAEIRTATVTFTAGALTKTVPVSLTINAPRANFVSPYVVPAGPGGNVIIRGYGFSGLNAISLQVLFNATPASAAFVISDTEIQAAYPSLGAGSYPISVSDGTIILPSRSELKLLVINPPAYSAATVTRTSSPGSVGNLIYDAERQALYVMDADNARLERYSFTGAWALNGTNNGLGGATNPRIALSPDGTEILGTSAGQILRISPVTLATFSQPVANIGGSFLQGNMIAFANDGGAIGTCSSPSGITAYRYDMLTQQFSAFSTQPDMVNRQVVASGDGDTLFMPTFESLILSFAKPVLVVDASANTLTQLTPMTTSSERVSVSRNGARVIMRTLQSDSGSDNVARVYDYAGGGVLSFRGDLPAGDNGFVISPDGNIAYVYYGATGLVRKFDLANPSLPQIGSTSIASPGTFSSAMTISPDGGTLFLAGNQQVVIVPAP